MGAHGGITDFTIKLLLGDQSGYRVEDNDVDGIGAHQSLADLQRFLTRIGLRDEQVVQIHPQFAGVIWVQGVLDINEGSETTLFLRLSNGGESEGRLAR